MPGSVRGDEPVAMTRPSNASWSPESSASCAREVDGLRAVPTAGRGPARRTGACAARAARARTPREELLRQWRPVVREVGLCAHEHEPAVESFTPQRLDARRPASDAPTTAIVCSSMREA